MIPIDEMLLDLRAVLESFEENPCDDTFALVQKETMRIQCYCEDLLVENEE